MQPLGPASRALVLTLLTGLAWGCTPSKTRLEDVLESAMPVPLDPKRVVVGEVDWTTIAYVLQDGRDAPVLVARAGTPLTVTVVLEKSGEPCAPDGPYAGQACCPETAGFTWKQEGREVELTARQRIVTGSCSNRPWYETTDFTLPDLRAD